MLSISLSCLIRPNAFSQSRTTRCISVPPISAKSANLLIMLIACAVDLFSLKPNCAVSKECGLKLKKERCKQIKINTTQSIKFQNGFEVPWVDNATYLGAKLDNTCNANKEINKRLSTCSALWKKLGMLWKKNSSTNKKRNVSPAS